MSDYGNIIVYINVGKLTVIGYQDGRAFKVHRSYACAADVVERVKLIYNSTGVWARVRLGRDTESYGWQPFHRQVLDLLIEYKYNVANHTYKGKPQQLGLPL